MSSQLESTSASLTDRLLGGGLWRTGLIAAVAAGVANLVVALVAKAGDVSMAVAMGGDAREDLPMPLFFVMSVVGVLAATGFAAVLARRPNGNRTFVIAASVLAVLSLVGPITADATSGTKLVLATCHVIVAAIAIPALGTSARVGTATRRRGRS
jgi:Family of unknown function (DUF6069)